MKIARLLPISAAIFAVVTFTSDATRSKVAWRRHYRVGDHNGSVQLPYSHHKYLDGPNMCAVEHIPELGRTLYTDSSHWLRRDVCGFKTRVQMKCCEGYTNVHGSGACTGVLAMRSLLKTARSMGAGLFVDYIVRTPSAHDVLSRAAEEGAVTLFAPSDEAIHRMTPMQRQAFEVNLHRHLLYHALPGRVELTDLPEGDTDFKSLDGYQTPLRISRFSNQIDTVNCRLVTRRNHRASDGVVHVIDSVLEAPASSGQATLLNVLSSDQRFSELYRLVSTVPDVVDLLRNARSTLTLMAPTNDAFQSMEPAQLARIQHDYTLAKMVLQLHLIPHSMCASAVTERHTVRTLSGAKISIDCDRHGVSVSDQQTRFLQDYQLASNGFLSAVDKVIVPNPVRSVWDLMTARRDLKLFVDLVRQYGLEHYMRDSTVTVFAPNNDALRSWARKQGIFYDNNLYETVARKLMYNHVVYGQRIPTAHFIDGKAVYSLERASLIRMKVARKWYGVDLAKLVVADVQASNGVLHVIDRVLEPRRLHFRDWISHDMQDNVDTRRFVSLIRRTRSLMDELEHIGSTNATAVTIFAPEDEAFEGWDIDQVLNTPQKIENFVRGHIVRADVALESMPANATYLLSSESRQPVRIRIDAAPAAAGDSLSKTRLVNGAHVIRADTMLVDGILHSVNRALVDPTASHVTAVGRRVVPRKTTPADASRGRDIGGNVATYPVNGTKCFDNGAIGSTNGTRCLEHGASLPNNGSQRPDIAIRRPDNGTKHPDNGIRSPGHGTRSPGHGTRSPGHGTRRRTLLSPPPPYPVTKPADADQLASKEEPGRY